MPAYFCDADGCPQGVKNTMSWWWKPWFYKHVGWMLDDGRGERWELVPLRDYYHRHTKSIFWELEQIIPVGNHWLFRLLLGWAVPPKVSFLKLTQTEALRKMYEEQHVIQDMLVPISDMSESLDVFHEKYDLQLLCLHRAYVYGATTARATGASSASPSSEIQTDAATASPTRCTWTWAPTASPAPSDKKPFDAVARGRAVESFVMEKPASRCCTRQLP